MSGPSWVPLMGTRGHFPGFSGLFLQLGGCSPNPHLKFQWHIFTKNTLIADGQDKEFIAIKKHLNNVNYFEGDQYGAHCCYYIICRWVTNWPIWGSRLQHRLVRGCSIRPSLWCTASLPPGTCAFQGNVCLCPKVRKEHSDIYLALSLKSSPFLSTTTTQSCQLALWWGSAFMKC